MEGTRRPARTAEGNLKGKSYVRQFSERTRVDSGLRVLPDIAGCTTYGIRGTLSVVELGTLKLRLQHGREAKASRGELGRCLAPGYVFDATGRIVKAPNLRVQEAIGLVFRKFNEVASIRQTYCQRRSESAREWPG